MHTESASQCGHTVSASQCVHTVSASQRVHTVSASQCVQTVPASQCVQTVPGILVLNMPEETPALKCMFDTHLWAAAQPRISYSNRSTRVGPQFKLKLIKSSGTVVMAKLYSGEIRDSLSYCVSMYSMAHVLCTLWLGIYWSMLHAL